MEKKAKIGKIATLACLSPNSCVECASTTPKSAVLAPQTARNDREVVLHVELQFVHAIGATVARDVLHRACSTARPDLTCRCTCLRGLHVYVLWCHPSSDFSHIAMDRNPSEPHTLETLTAQVKVNYDKAQLETGKLKETMGSMRQDVAQLHTLHQDLMAAMTELK